MNSETAGPSAGQAGAGWGWLVARARWEELILPAASRDRLRSIAGDLRFRRPAEREADTGPAARRRAGMKLMFAGEVGTGKRLAARALAADLGLPILSVELATVAAQSEEPLDHLFGMAERAGAIIYFADAGTWLGNRTPALDARVPREDPALAFLLKRLDAYPGVVIFAATLGIACAPIIERLDHVVEFPFPDEAARLQIWRLLLPGSAQLGTRELDFLVSSFPLTGGAIRRCAAAAVSSAAGEGAPTTLRHVVAAVEGEYRGRPQSARVRGAFERFHAGTWEASPAVSAPPPARGHWHPEVRDRVDLVRGRVDLVRGRVDLVRGHVDSARDRVDRTAVWLHSHRAVARGLVVGAVLAAALLGFLIARAPRASVGPLQGLDAHLASGLLRVSVPRGWHRQDPPRSLALGLADKLVVGPRPPAGGSLVIGRTSTTGAALPQGLLNALPQVPTPQVVTLDGTRFYRYIGLAPRGVNGTESVYVLPTTIGTVLGECLERGAAAGFASTCERAIGTIALASGRVLPIPPATYAAAFDAAITKLESTVAGVAGRLHTARTAAEQAAVADAAATAYRSAASTVGGLQAGAAQADSQAVAAALHRIADAYAALGRAAAHSDRRGYGGARRSLARADSALRAAIARLAVHAYAPS